MSRLDVMRYVLYGQRFTDTKEKTVLERAPIPSDLHAWVKVYSGSDLREFANLAGSGTTFSFCSATRSATGAPLMRVAEGALRVGLDGQQPVRYRTSQQRRWLRGHSRSATDYTVRVEV